MIASRRATVRAGARATAAVIVIGRSLGDDDFVIVTTPETPETVGMFGRS